MLNNTAFEIAEYLEKGESVENIADNLTRKYSIPHEQTREDVLYVLHQLNQKDFLTQDTSLSKRIPKLESLFFHLTTRCNLRCPHCYLETRSAKIPLRSIFALLDELAANGGKSVTLSGGEPLLYSGLKELIEYAASKELGIELLTNGTLIDKEWASFFLDKKLFIQISLDGSTKDVHDTIRGKGNFDRTVRGIKYFQDAGLGERLTLCATIMKQNLHDLPNIVSLTKALNIPKVRFLPLRKVGRAEKEWNAISGMDIKAYEQFFQYISVLQREKDCGIDLTCGLAGFLLYLPKTVSDDDIWCPVGKKLVIDTNGDVYPCVLMMADSFRLGNIYSDSLSQLIHSEKMAEICDALTTRRNKIPECVKCRWHNFCQSGCMGQASDHKGTIWETDDFCDYRKKAYKEAFDKILQISGNPH